MKNILFVALYCSLVISGLFIEIMRENTREDTILIVKLEKDIRQLSKIVLARETIKQKRIELDYLWPIHIEDWIPGP